MTNTYTAGAFYGFTFTLKEAITKKNVQYSPEMEKYIEENKESMVRDFLHDVMNDTFSRKYKKQIFLDHTGMDHLEEEFYVAVQDSVSELDGDVEWAKPIEALNDPQIDQRIPEWNILIREFCEKHNLPHKEPAWFFKLGYF